SVDPPSARTIGRVCASDGGDAASTNTAAADRTTEARRSVQAIADSFFAGPRSEDSTVRTVDGSSTPRRKEQCSAEGAPLAGPCADPKPPLLDPRAPVRVDARELRRPAGAVGAQAHSRKIVRLGCAALRGAAPRVAVGLRDRAVRVGLALRPHRDA